MDRPQTRYVRSGDVHVAYQAIGDGPIDILFAMGVPLSIDSLWDAPPAVRFLRRLASFARVIMFDRRGVGLSDPISIDSPPTLEQWMEDALSVLDDIRSDRVALVGSDIHGGQVCLLLAATCPSRVSAAVVINSAASLRVSSTGLDVRSGLGTPPKHSNAAEWLASAESFAVLAPSLAVDGALCDWWQRSLLRSVSHGVAETLLALRDNSDVTAILPTIRVPTLVLSRRGNRAYPSAYGRFIAERVPDVRYVEFEGADQLVFAGDFGVLVDEVQEFLTGVRPAQDPDRVLATVLFTDIVQSTRRAVELGDRRWHLVLDEHDAFIDRQLIRFGGRRVHAIGQGDGVLATFEGPARAIRCAQAIVEGVRVLDLQVRCGVHTGEIERRERDIGGVAVHIAARVKEHAGASEVLVSRTVTDLVAGSGLEFEDRGSHPLKGIPGTWQLLAVRG